MRTIGTRKETPFSFEASAALLKAGCRFNDEMHRLPSGKTSFMPKGVTVFRTHAEANLHQEQCVAEGMAKIARERK